MLTIECPGDGEYPILHEGKSALEVQRAYYPGNQLIPMYANHVKPPLSLRKDMRYGMYYRLEPTFISLLEFP